jgi:hypothetical protein
MFYIHGKPSATLLGYEKNVNDLLLSLEYKESNDRYVLRYKAYKDGKKGNIAHSL